MHRSTLEIKLKFFHFVKLSSHNASLYSSVTETKHTEADGSSHHWYGGYMDLRDWKTWCKELGPKGSLPKRALLAGMSQRKTAKQSVRALPKAKPKKLSKNQVPVCPGHPKDDPRGVIHLLCVS